MERVMDLRQLEIFLEAARWLNFTHAAKALHIAQPAVSQAIAKMESDLGVLLFERSGREVRLTEVGTRLVAHAERILAEVHAAERDIARLRGRALGRISVGVTPTVATHLLPRALAAYRTLRPEMETVLRMVAAGLGVSLVPQLAFADIPRTGVVGLSVSDPPLARTLGVAHRHDRPLSPAAEDFVATLRASITI